MHEELFPNEPLETKMDLHNNKIGMDYFMEILPEFIASSLKKLLCRCFDQKMDEAKVLKNLDDDFEGHLVYLEE